MGKVKLKELEVVDVVGRALEKYAAEHSPEDVAEARRGRKILAIFGAVVMGASVIAAFILVVLALAQQRSGLVLIGCLAIVAGGLLVALFSFLSEKGLIPWTKKWSEVQKLI